MTKIYESPDKGLTVYSRDFNNTEKTLVRYPVPIHWKARWYNWEEILQLAETNHTLNDLIKKAEEVYALIKK